MGYKYKSLKKLQFAAYGQFVLVLIYIFASGDDFIGRLGGDAVKKGWS